MIDHETSGVATSGILAKTGDEAREAVVRRQPRLGFWYRFVVYVVKPLLLAFTTREWRGLENLPREGGFIVAANHLSYVDPLVVAHCLYDAGRPPRFLAKASLFRMPVLKWILTGAKQIPVHRDTADASQALSAAVDALHRGECVFIYPEGSATRDPELWPMRARTGVARLALLSGAPVIPVAQWGAHELLPYPTKKVHLLPRKHMQILVGPPVDLSAYEGRQMTSEVLREATEAIMRRIADQLVELRGGTAPGAFFDPRAQPSVKESA
jgi:1-acyl-sn-glycerol-3-phosphate acyltransferase